MRWKLMVLPVLALFFIGAALPARAQVTYSAQEGKLPFTVGAGFSDFSDDWGVRNPRQVGITMWVDWRLPHMPPLLDGLGLEFEGRDVNYGPLRICRATEWIQHWVGQFISSAGRDGFAPLESM